MDSGSVHIGEVSLGTPIVLSPMAGVTNPPFRQICREFAEQGARDAGVPDVAPGRTDGTFAPAGLYVCEMITTRALVEGVPETLRMVQPDVGDPVRSIQLYGVQPHTTAKAVEILIEQDLADHIDLNFGCPVPKVTRKGGGSALPWKRDLFFEIVSAAVRSAERASRGRSHTVPVTAKFRIGIDDDHETLYDALELCERAGISAVTLHARTLEQHYSGRAQWNRIADLKERAHIPVFGNGDVFECADAERITSETGCDGIAIGRGCQGRPWVFYDLAAYYHGSGKRMRPRLSEVADVIMRHAELSVQHFADEHRAVREMRKHMSWYLRGFAVGGESRHALGLVSSLAELRSRLDSLDLDQPYPPAATGARGRAGGAKRAHLPEHWLESRELNAEQRRRITEAEIGVSGG